MNSGPQLVGSAIFDPTTGAISKGSGVSVTVNTALQEWGIGLDNDTVGQIDADSMIALAQVSSLPGATARVVLCDWSGNTLSLKAIDPATGALANVTGDVRVMIWRFSPS